jgi:hypothetical protein
MELASAVGIEDPPRPMTAEDCPLLTRFFTTYEKCMVDTPGCCSEHAAVRADATEAITVCPEVGKILEKCDGGSSSSNAGAHIAASSSVVATALIMQVLFA